MWRQPIGGGYSSFAIAGGLAFTTEQRRDNEVAVAYVVSDGREVWTNSWAEKISGLFRGDWAAGDTPYSEGKVYFLGAEGELRCLEAANGRQIWGDNLLARLMRKSPPTE